MQIDRAMAKRYDGGSSSTASPIEHAIRRRNSASSSPPPTLEQLFGQVKRMNVRSMGRRPMIVGLPSAGVIWLCHVMCQRGQRSIHSISRRKGPSIPSLIINPMRLARSF
ncbi:MAG: hypothetical protein ACI8Y4_004848 [Candidatus Poriferisodalaceae bacterium]|jgi:hypothetical protein